MRTFLVDKTLKEVVEVVSEESSKLVVEIGVKICVEFNLEIVVQAGNKLCVKSFIYFIFLIQQSQHWPDSMRVPIVTFETQKYRLSDITRYYSSQLLYQLYQKKQLRKSTNFSNLILSTESITIFSSEKQ